ncbi:MAG TPA: ornithine cyclodeaminase family protein [Pirellulaceae bacterium]|nr:ornithine cyclodeaminase family protein [Pirellulaceae bacterium]
MSVLYLREDEIASLVTMPEAIEAMRAAFVALAQGEAENVPRVRAQAPGVVLHSLSAAAGYLGLVGWKQYTTTRQGAKFLVGLHEATGGNLVALLEADHLGQLRTGAVSGLAMELLANPAAESLGLFGTGWQAESQLLAAIAARPIKKVLVYSRKEENRRDFATRMSERLGIDVEPVDDPRRASEYQPIVITATTSKEPVFDGKWLSPGTLVCAMGSNWLSKAEIDVATVEGAQLIVCDSVAACQAEAGDFIQPLAQGVFRWENAVELSAIVAGQHAGRRAANDRIVFKSVGLGIEDVALGAVVLTNAKQRGVGQALPI